MDRPHVSRSPVVGPSKPRLVKVLGAGLISGAANDDPTAIATYSQAGAQFGFALSWLMFVIYPLMAVVQQVSARMGRTTGNGLAGNVRRHYPRWLLQLIVLLLLISNTVAISADLAAMADVLRLLIGGPPLVYVLLFGVVCVLLQMYMQYTRYVAVLKWITLSLLSYFGAVLMVDVRWGEFLDAIVNPRIMFDKDYLMMIVAIFGVALSPYVAFWQSSQEAEDQRVKPKREPLVEAPEQAPKALERIRLDTYIGMAWPISSGLRSLSPRRRRYTPSASTRSKARRKQPKRSGPLPAPSPSPSSPSASSVRDCWRSRYWPGPRHTPSARRKGGPSVWRVLP